MTKNGKADDGDSRGNRRGKGRRYIDAGMAAFHYSGVDSDSDDGVPESVKHQNMADAAEILDWARISETLNFRARRYSNRMVVIASRAGDKVEEYQDLVVQSIMLGRPLWMWDPGSWKFLYVSYPLPFLRWLLVTLIIFLTVTMSILMHNQTITVDQLTRLIEVTTELVREVASVAAKIP